MRLIDADELLKKINRKYPNTNRDIKELIGDAPTAFDIDKVIEELEKENLEYQVRWYATKQLRKWLRRW